MIRTTSALGTCASTAAHATAAPAEPIGTDANTDVDSASSPTTVSDAVSSSASSNAASAPTLRASAAAASRLGHHFDVLHSRAKHRLAQGLGRGGIGHAQPCRGHPIARLSHRAVGADDRVGQVCRRVNGQVQGVLVVNLTTGGGRADHRQARHSSCDSHPEDYVHPVHSLSLTSPLTSVQSYTAHPRCLNTGAKVSTLRWHTPGVTQKGNRQVSDQRYDAPTAAVATTAAPAVARSPRVGYVPASTNKVRDGLAVALLVLALLLPWNLEFGLGVPNSNGPLFVLIAAVTLLAIAAALTPHVGPFRLGPRRPTSAAPAGCGRCSASPTRSS